MISGYEVAYRVCHQIWQGALEVEESREVVAGKAGEQAEEDGV